MIVVSVDPGLSGACAVLDHNGLRAVFDLPTMEIPNVGPKALVKRKVDARAFTTQLLQHCPVGTAVQAVVEGVQVMAGKNNAVQTQGALLRTLGAIETVLECLNWAPSYAHPQTWKRFFGLVDGELSDAQRKGESLRVARALYPDRAELARAKDHNRAEAVLIAHWWREKKA